MEEYLNKIIEIDAEARQKVIEMENKKKNIEETIERETTRQKSNVHAEMQFKLDFKKRNIEKDYETFQDNMNAYLKEQLELIDKQYAADKNDIIEQCFNHIVSKKKV